MGNFCHHAHFTYRFRVRELRARIFYTGPIIQRDIDARDWTDSRTGLALKRFASRTLEVTIRTRESAKRGVRSNPPRSALALLYPHARCRISAPCLALPSARNGYFILEVYVCHRQPSSLAAFLAT